MPEIVIGECSSLAVLEPLMADLITADIAPLADAHILAIFAFLVNDLPVEVVKWRRETADRA